MSHQPTLIYEFGDYRLDAIERLLQRNGEIVLLQPKRCSDKVRGEKGFIENIREA
jgi:hypothetical protein